MDTKSQANGETLQLETRFRGGICYFSITRTLNCSSSLNKTMYFVFCISFEVSDSLVIFLNGSIKTTVVRERVESGDRFAVNIDRIYYLECYNISCRNISCIIPWNCTLVVIVNESLCDNRIYLYLMKLLIIAFIKLKVNPITPTGSKMVPHGILWECGSATPDIHECILTTLTYFKMKWVIFVPLLKVLSRAEFCDCGPFFLKLAN